MVHTEDVRENINCRNVYLIARGKDHCGVGTVDTALSRLEDLHFTLGIDYSVRCWKPPGFEDTTPSKICYDELGSAARGLDFTAPEPRFRGPIRRIEDTFSVPVTILAEYLLA